MEVVQHSRFPTAVCVEAPPEHSSAAVLAGSGPARAGCAVESAGTVKSHASFWVGPIRAVEAVQDVFVPLSVLGWRQLEHGTVAVGATHFCFSI
jgi:hypothetical protein